MGGVEGLSNEGVDGVIIVSQVKSIGEEGGKMVGGQGGVGWVGDGREFG